MNFQSPEYDSMTTSITLLARLDDVSDQMAWHRFVEKYSPHIFLWCKRFGLQESDAADVTQTVLLKLVKLMQEFDYDQNRGSFRGWLKTVTSNLTRDSLRSRKNEQKGSGSTDVWEQLQNIDDPKAFNELANLIQQQYEQELVEVAGSKVKARVQAHTWSAYIGTAVDLRPATEVAKELEMPVAEVYVAKSRVIKMIREEIQQLDHFTE